MGVLTCLRLSDTVTTVVNYNLENNLDTTEDYNFETYRSHSLQDLTVFLVMYYLLQRIMPLYAWPL